MTALHESPTTGADRAALLAAAVAETEDGARTVSRVRRRILGTAGLAAAAAMVAAPVVAPWEGDGEWIATLVEHPTRGQAGALLYWTAFLLSLATVLAMASMVRRRAVRLGLVGTVFALIGAAAQPGLLITDWWQLALGQTLPLQDALAVDQRMEQYVALAPLYMVGFLAGTAGTALLAVAAWRAGWLHPVVPAVYVLAFISIMSAPTEARISVVVWSFMASFHVLVALRVLRAGDDEWQAGVPLPRAQV